MKLTASLCLLDTVSSQKAKSKPVKECVFTKWSGWSACTWLCGPHGTKERTRQIRLPRNGQPCLSNGLEPVLKEVESCNRKCLNDGRLGKDGCVCKPANEGTCCEVNASPITDKCFERFREPDSGKLKCSKSLTEEWNWACNVECEKGTGMYRATGDIYTCNAYGWDQKSLELRTFDFDDYDDSTPSLPLPDCAERKLIKGVTEKLKLVYVSTMEPAVLESLIESEDENAAVPQVLLNTINQECAKKSGPRIRFTADYNISLGNSLGKRRVLRESDDDDEIIFTSFNGATEPIMAFDLGLNNLPDTEVAEHEGDTGRSVIAGIPFTIDVGLKFEIKQEKHVTWAEQSAARNAMNHCVTSILSEFKAEMETDEALASAGVVAASQFLGPDQDDPNWPQWDREGAQCAQGSILLGGSVSEPIECQACPKGTVYVSKARGTLEICRPCPSGSWMDAPGQIANKNGELGQCNDCPSPAFMTSSFPAYSKTDCQKTSCFPNQTKFQVVFAIDSSGSVTRPDYIRMREFAKSIVSRMCINNSKEDGVKSCGQAAYVIYNQSAESYLKFKQVETAEDFNKINNYEYRGGPPRIGDLFEFIHDTYVDTTQLKRGLPLNVILISDGQTQNDDKEKMSQFAAKLKKHTTKIITLSKRSEYNGNTLQLASSLEDRYFMNDYHELPNFVFPVMEKLCETISQHKSRR